MQIGRILRFDHKPLIVDRQVGIEVPLGLSDRLNVPDGHLLHQPVLERLEQPLYPSLGLRGVGMDDLHCQLC